MNNRKGMKWKSHTAIARAIAEEADIHGECRQALYQGVIDPDRSPDYHRKRSTNGTNTFSRAAHHHPSTSMVMSYVWEARKAYLENDDVAAMRSIGRALHYIQDKSVSRGFRGWTHDRREEAISKLEAPAEEVKRGFSEAQSSPDFVRECIVAVKNKKNPHKALKEGTYYSALIFASVFSPAENSCEMRNKSLRQYKHRKILLGVSIMTAALAAVSLFFEIYPLTAASALAAAIMFAANRHYKDVKRKASWYGTRKS